MRSIHLEFMKAYQPAAFCVISHTFSRTGVRRTVVYRNELGLTEVFRVLKACTKSGERIMKYAGLLVMPAGFFLSIAAIILFPDPAPRLAFVFCGLAVEAMGLVVAVRGHMGPRKEQRP
jgi:hypothetical protein